jgi:hypothetical protein
MRRLLALIPAVVVFAGLAVPPASAQTPDAVTVARTLIANENAHNVNAVVDMFAPGAVVNLPTGVFATRAGILEWQQELAAGNFHAEITNPVAVTPEVVTFSGTVALDLFRGLGLASLDSTWQLTIQLGKVTVFNFDFTPAATARLNAAIAAASAPTTTAPRAATAAAGGTTAGGTTAGGTTAAAPATATSARLALTGVDMRPAEGGATAIAVGLLLVALARRRSASQS